MMRVVHNLDELSAPERPSAISIGNFDGIHLAHQQLLRRVVEFARPAGAAAVAMTFDPHPARILAPDRAPTLLSSPEQKARLIEPLGIDLLVILPFTPELARVSPEDFVQDILIHRLRASSVHVGPNFRFGHRQAGTTDLLGKMARQYGFQLEVLPMLKLRGEFVSSSRIRRLLSAGRVSIAGRLLGRPYSTAGPIVSGLGIGKTQTVPTLNLGPIKELLPKRGVYVTRTRLGERLHDSVTNVGYKPTFGEHQLTVESHLLNPQALAHAKEMEIQFLLRLRDEVKFSDPAALLAQIRKDAARAHQYFRLSGRLVGHRRESLGES
ncbi:MAG: bifunctional riboflavin kinase/FAD synthetase, partial [Deltaproteobacteria bacterium]